MEKRIILVPVNQLTGSQLSMLLYSSAVRVISSEYTDSGAYLACMADRHRPVLLPVATDPELYRELSGNRLGIESVLTHEQSARLETLLEAQYHAEIMNKAPPEFRLAQLLARILD